MDLEDFPPTHKQGSTSLDFIVNGGLVRESSEHALKLRLVKL